MKIKDLMPGDLIRSHNDSHWFFVVETWVEDAQGVLLVTFLDPDNRKTGMFCGALATIDTLVVRDGEQIFP